jgi:hypothetical protein
MTISDLLIRTAKANGGSAKLVADARFVNCARSELLNKAPSALAGLTFAYDVDITPIRMSPGGILRQMGDPHFAYAPTERFQIFKDDASYTNPVTGWWRLADCSVV